MRNMKFDKIDVYNDGTTVSIEVDCGQVELITEAIRRAIPLFAAEKEMEIVAELTAIVKELEA